MSLNRFSNQRQSEAAKRIRSISTRLGLVIFFVLLVCCTISYADVGKYDYGNSSSETLTAKAWDALIEKDYKAILVYAKRCISLYESRAVAQQNLLKELPTGDDVFQYWALNDVGTCYYLKGEAYFAKKKYKLACRAYKKVIRKFPFAQYYDPGGFHVKVVDCCEKKLVAVEAILGQEEEPSPESTMEKIDIRERLKEFDKKKEEMRGKEG